MMFRFNRTRSQVDRERGKKVGGKSDAKNQHNTEARKGEREEKKKQRWREKLYGSKD